MKAKFILFTQIIGIVLIGYVIGTLHIIALNSIDHVIVVGQTKTAEAMIASKLP